MKSIVITIPGSEEFGRLLIEQLNAEEGKAIIRHFPDGETYVKVLTEVYGKEVIVVSSFHNPDEKILPLYLLTKTLKEFGASSVILVAPYLAYVRQDKRFSYGECANAILFAKLLSTIVDQLITIEPHFHEKHSLEQLYGIHTSAVSVSELISRWIAENIQSPLIVSPDDESSQWVGKIAENLGAPFLKFSKQRRKDDEVELTVSPHKLSGLYKPVIVDDTISTGATMKEAITWLKKNNMQSPVCIGIHAVFSKGAFGRLITAGAEKIITCNSIPHPTNTIHLEKLMAEEVGKNVFVLN